MDEQTHLPLSAASDLLRRRAVSSVELTEATLRRIEQTEPVVHAYALILAERARRAASHADRELAQGRWHGPLHGIPIAIKDICYMRDLPNEAGSRAMAGFVPGYDATVVRRLEDAGAVVVGKTVTHEFAYGVNVPPTRTPWNLECYPGGSSAGSGVAVAIGTAYAAVGTDTGGSIRVPAAINGIVGLKPTFGRVSRYGIVPLAASLDHPGPLTRTVEDCAIFLQAIAGYDSADAGSVDVPVPDYRAELHAGVAGITIGVERAHFFYGGVTDDVRRGVEEAVDTLRRLGATIVEVELPELSWSPQVLMTILGAEASTIHRQRLRERPDDYDPATRRSLELGEFIPATHYLTAQRARALLKNRMQNLFAAHKLDALLSPTLPMTTVPIPELHIERPDYPGESPVISKVHHTFSANLTGQPALSVPCGLASNGLPFAFQLLGRPFAEATVFRIARAYEREYPWSTIRPEIPTMDTASV
jgi:aspartyl-tRNA(Asn)/glutamyl-tRNA(Gln) amidotransferase subunit A